MFESSGDGDSVVAVDTTVGGSAPLLDGDFVAAPAVRAGVPDLEADLVLEEVGVPVPKAGAALVE